MLSNKRHFAYNILTSYGNTVITSVLAFVSVPIALKYWGNELYGIWIILTSFATYITASGLGIDSATGLLMTKNNSLAVKQAILKKGVKLLICSSFLAICIIVLITVIIPDWFKIIGKMDESNYPIAKISALIFITGIIINLPLSAVSNSLQAFGKVYISTLINSLQSVLCFIAIIFTSTLKLSLPLYVLQVQIITIFCNLLKLIVVVCTIKKEQNSNSISEIGFIDSPDNHYGSILKMGINLSLCGLAVLLVPNLSNLIISNNIDINALIPYSLLYKLFSTIIVFATNMNCSLAPLLGIEYGKGNWEWLTRTYNKMFYVSTTLSAFLILNVIWFSRTFITIWTGASENYAGILITIILGFYFFITVFSNMNNVVINSFNYTNKIWLISWADGFIFLLFSILLIKKLGVLSVPLGLFVGALSVSSWAYPLVIYRRTEKRFKYDFKYLLKLLVVFCSSVIVFIVFSYFNLSILLMTVLDFFGMLITVIFLFIIMPIDVRIVILSKIKKKLRN